MSEPIKAPEPELGTALGYGVKVGSTLLSVSFSRETERDMWLRDFGMRHPDAGDHASKVMVRLNELKEGDDDEKEG